MYLPLKEFHVGSIPTRSTKFASSKADRIILITDEQSHDRVAGPKNYGADVGYIINVGAYRNGVNHGEWTTVTASLRGYRGLYPRI